MFDDLTHRTKHWLRYQKTAKTKYYLHSPFVYSFYINYIEGAPTDEIQRIERQFLKAKNDPTPLQIQDYGATPGHYTKRVLDIAKKAATEQHFGALMHRWLKQDSMYFVLEIGTSLGFGTAYMASAKPDLEIYTLDAATEVQAFSKSLHHQLDLKNITYIEGQFDIVLPPLLKEIPRIDFAYIDGNHTEEATLRYFEWLKPKLHEHSVVVFDDIYWSRGMTAAWEKIKADTSVSLSIDLYRQGWVFFGKEKLAKEHFVLRF
jgi:predicted O-methyltransferase YrrM